VAKTISAYDKEVSDDLYGSGSRYVSKQRLEAMLGNEWAQLLTNCRRLAVAHSLLFLCGYRLRAQLPEPMTRMDGSGCASVAARGLPNDVLLHINMLDPANALQQEAIGILASISSMLRSTNCKPRNLFWEAWHKTLSRNVLKSTTSISRPDSRVGISVRC